MLTLSLLLSAAAGVNAILGGEVAAVKIAEGQFICADNCVHDGVYFDQTGFYCPVQEVVARVNQDGTDDTYFPFLCAGDKLPSGSSERPRRDGEEPEQCNTLDGEPVCAANRISSPGKKPMTIEWSDVAKQLKEATPQDGLSSPEKPVNCAVEGSIAFQKCQKESNPSFGKCNKKGLEAIEKCRQH